MMSNAHASSFTNVGRTRFWQRGFLASQSAYVLAALIVLVVVMSLLSPNFLTGGNISNITRNFSFIAIATLGITLVIITGGIDLSVGSTIALSATVTSLTMNALAGANFYPFAGSALVISLVAGLGAAAAVGLFNGLAIAKLKLSPFVTTLGTLSMVRGLVYVATQGRGTFPAGPDKDMFLAVTAGKLFDVVPVSFLYLIICAVVMWVALNHTAWGKHVFAIGSNENAGRLTGVNVDRTISLTFVLGASLAAVAGMLFLMYYGVIDFFIGFLAGIKAFTAAVLGGIGSLPGAMLGGLLIGLIEVFWAAYFSSEYKDVAAFAILVLVLIFRPTGLLGKPEIEKV